MSLLMLIDIRKRWANAIKEVNDPLYRHWYTNPNPSVPAIAVEDVQWMLSELERAYSVLDAVYYALHAAYVGGELYASLPDEVNFAVSKELEEGREAFERVRLLLGR